MRDRHVIREDRGVTCRSGRKSIRQRRIIQLDARDERRRLYGLRSDRILADEKMVNRVG